MSTNSKKHSIDEFPQLTSTFRSYQSAVSRLDKSVEILGEKIDKIRDNSTFSKEAIDRIVEQQNGVIKNLNELSRLSKELKTHVNHACTVLKSTSENAKDCSDIARYHQDILNKCNSVQNKINLLIRKLNVHKNTMELAKGDELVRALGELLEECHSMHYNRIEFRQNIAEMKVPSVPVINIPKLPEATFVDGFLSVIALGLLKAIKTYSSLNSNHKESSSSKM